MQATSSQQNFGLIRQLLWLQLLLLSLLILFRILLFWLYSPGYDDHFALDIVNAFWLGFRIDIVLVSYLFIIPLLMMIVNRLIGNKISIEALKRFMKIYFIGMYLLVSAIIGMDFAFFSYFNEHINILIFGIFDDDTWALVEIAKKNYNLFLITSLAAVYVALLIYLISMVIEKSKAFLKHIKPLYQVLGYVGLVLLVFLGARGSVGTFPLLKLIPDISTDIFINALPKNGVFSLQKANGQYWRSQKGSYGAIKAMGYEGDHEKAFKDFLHTDQIDSNELFKSLDKTTKSNTVVEKRPPHVVVVMIEGFGSPILAYQSPEFDIMRRLKKHFDEDIVFMNFVSTQSGTIASLEPMLLNLMSHPGGVTFGQGREQKTAYTQAAARVYQQNGYETSFVYGGELGWRNVGAFFSQQGFDHVVGKHHIKEKLIEVEEHVYGVYDRYAYAYILKTLKESKKPQFVFLLTTNNHPPYILESNYKSGPLKISPEQQKNIIGNMELYNKRIRDYQYAVDMAGLFMDEIKATELSNNTVVAMTADNNTMTGVLHHGDHFKTSQTVPFYLYLPSYLETEQPDITLPGSQKDIFPTLYNRTLSNVTYRSLGSDLFDNDVLHCGINTRGVIIAPDKIFAPGKESSDLQKACVQQYRAAMAINQMIVENQK